MQPTCTHVIGEGAAGRRLSVTSAATSGVTSRGSTGAGTYFKYSLVSDSGDRVPIRSASIEDEALVHGSLGLTARTQPPQRTQLRFPASPSETRPEGSASPSGYSTSSAVPGFFRAGSATLRDAVGIERQFLQHAAEAQIIWQRQVDRAAGSTVPHEVGWNIATEPEALIPPTHRPPHLAALLLEELSSEGVPGGHAPHRTETAQSRKISVLDPSFLPEPGSEAERILSQDPNYVRVLAVGPVRETYAKQSSVCGLRSGCAQRKPKVHRHIRNIDWMYVEARRQALQLALQQHLMAQAGDDCRKDLALAGGSLSSYHCTPSQR